MNMCICNISALEFYRASGRLLPDVLDLPRTSKLDGCGIPSRIVLEDELPRLGIQERPIHVLVGSDAAKHVSAGGICHRRLSPLPLRSLIRISKTTLVTSPETTFCTLAENERFDVIDLALIGFELCGTYVLDASWEGLTNTLQPMTSVEKIQRVLSALGNRAGTRLSRQALPLVLDHSNSPMESILALLFTAPRTHGGLGIKGGRMNYKVTTPVGSKYVDLAFPTLGVGFEYKGKRFHSIEQAGRDDRRQNKLSGSGISILNVWYEDLLQPHLFQQLVNDFARTANIRLRIRSKSFEQRQLLLRTHLMPAVKRFGEYIA